MVGPGINWAVQVPRPISGALPPRHPTSGALPSAHNKPKPLVKLPSDPQLQSALASINTHRSHHQVSPMTWDDRLAAQAAKFVAKCPVQHSDVPGVGENIAFGHTEFAAAVDAWYSEAAVYSFEQPGFKVETGHFSQLVWKDSSRVGCAYNKACTWSTWTCWYDPPGEWS